MKKSMRQWVRQTYPQKADKIIKWSLSEKKIRQAGIHLYDHEVFTKYPKWDFYGSNYGRVISTKSGNLTLRAENIDPSGHITYVMSKPALRRKGKIIGEPTIFSISGQRIVGDLFLPNEWPELSRSSLQVHHLDHNRVNNKWTNLVMLPVYLHKYIEFVDSFWMYDGERYAVLQP